MSAEQEFIVNLNTNEIQRKSIEKVEILFDLNGDSYQIEDELHDKCIACLSGCCTIADTQNKQSVILDSQDMPVDIFKNINLKINDYSKDTKIIVTYYKDEVDG